MLVVLFFNMCAVIAGVNLNNLKANHNLMYAREHMDDAVIAGVNLNNLKANHNKIMLLVLIKLAVIAGVNLNNLKANHNTEGKYIAEKVLLSLA